MKRVGVFHNEFTGAHDAKAWPYFIAELGLNLIIVDRQLFVAADLAARDIGNDFLVRGSKAEAALVTVIEAQQFRAVLLPAAGFHPQFRRLYGRHQQLQCPGTVHFFAHDSLNLAQHPQAQW